MNVTHTAFEHPCLAHKGKRDEFSLLLASFVHFACSSPASEPDANPVPARYEFGPLLSFGVVI